MNVPRPPHFKRLFHFLFQGWRDAFRDVIAIMERFQTQPNPMVSLSVLLLSILIFWFVYVPVHELLHAAGCVLAGGDVQELVLAQKYGANLLSKTFPFIVPATSAYAGRLTGFDPGSDSGYLLTVAAPYILSVFPGVWLIRLAATRKNMCMAGTGMILGLAPFMNLSGDYFEISTIVSTKIWNTLLQGLPARSMENYWLLRSDDIFRLMSEISASPGKYGLPGAWGILHLGVVILFGLFLAVVLSGWTYALGRRISCWIEAKSS